MYKTQKLLRKISILQERYLTASIDKQALIKMIDEAEVAEQVYNSNAIENSTLSLDDTEKILLQVDLDRFVNERELFEAKNLGRVIAYISSKAEQRDIELDSMCLLHQMLISNIRDEIAGRFRIKGEWVKVGNHIAPDPVHVERMLQEMLIEYHTKNQDNIIRRIALFHLRFEHIHPFVDGNGRIGRVLNNYALIRNKLVPINIKFIDRADYYMSFREFERDQTTFIMEEIVGKALTQSFHKRLAYLEGKNIIRLNEYAKKNKLSYPNLINKAKRQSIEAFMQKGIWMIGE